MKKILFLGAQRNQEPALRTAKCLGLQVFAIDPDPHSVGFQHTIEYVVADLADRDTCLSFASRHRVDGILTVAAEYPMPTVAYLCEQLHLPGPSRHCVLLATNKYEMRLAMAASSIPIPKFHYATTPADALKAVRKLQSRVIVKPILGNGKKGITSISESATNEQILAAFERAFVASRNSGVLLEEYVEGREFSIEAVTVDGKTHVVAVTEKFTSGEPFHVELGHVVPARVSREQEAILIETTIRTIAALGINTSATHTEIRLATENVVNVIEIGARLGGGFITSHLVPLSTGVDLMAAAIRIAIGEQPELQRTQNGAAAIRFLTGTSGIVRKINSPTRICDNSEFSETTIYVRMGQETFELQDNSARIGHVICSASTAEIALSKTNSAADSVVIEIESLTPGFREITQDVIL